jgi:DNA recombination protein RmuC
MEMENLVVLIVILQLAVLAGLVVVILRLARVGDGQELAIDLGAVRENTERLERVLHDELSRGREEGASSLKNLREEVTRSLGAFGDSFRGQVKDIAMLQGQQLEAFARQLKELTTLNERKLEQIRETMEGKLKDMQEENSRKLEQMRQTVDEKLHATLEQRLGQSFKIVSERLEQVHRGLGEMQTLASGVGDLKRVLTNVRARGMWGEIQLGTLLEQMLTPEQYARNVATKPGSNERVEYAVKLPGRHGGDGRAVWLPIDAKFPQEDYQRLLAAQEQANAAMVDEASKTLESRIKAEAKAIKEKYLSPPHTTDFAIMFLPVEGLYAEVLRRAGLAEQLQREYRVSIAGPTTLSALLNSLQMGFRTLAIEKRSSEVWSLLGAVKTEFGRFGEILDRTQKKLQEASNSIETAAVRSRQIERKLRDVQDLPAQESLDLITHESGHGKQEEMLD